MKKLLILIYLAIVFAPHPAWGALSLSEEIKGIYNIYSEYLDTQWVALGWEYSVPSRHYREVGLTSIDDIRMQATLASAYRFRTDYSAQYKIKTALTNILGPGVPLVNSVPNGQGVRVSTRGFGDMIGLYLALELITERTDVFTKTEQAQIIKRIKEVYPYALSGWDNENRALLSAAYGLALLRAPELKLTNGEKDKYKKQIEDKIKIGLQAIDKNGVYREGRDQTYSLHYQLAAAVSLVWLGENLPNRAYLVKARQMLQYVHNRYPMGKLDWRGSERPTGIGLQTVLLRALGEKYLGNKKWLNYWQTEKEGRGFVDLDNPGRLVWRDEVDQTLNDDYSFLNMTELFYGK